MFACPERYYALIEATLNDGIVVKLLLPQRTELSENFSFRVLLVVQVGFPHARGQIVVVVS